MQKVLERAEATQVMRQLGDMAKGIEGFSVGQVRSSYDPFSGEIKVRVTLVKAGQEHVVKRKTEVYSDGTVRVGDLVKIGIRPETYRVDRFLRSGNVVIENVTNGKRYRVRPMAIKKVAEAPAMMGKTATGALIGELQR